MSKCRVCESLSVRETFTAQETMYGWGDQFDYFECGECGCIQLTHVPEDLERYYGDGYYSYDQGRRHGMLARKVKRSRTRYWLGERDILGWLAAQISTQPPHIQWVRQAGVRSSDRILDVGCGGGALLKQMQSNGFARLTGLDPYVDKQTADGSGLRILRTTLREVREVFDFVMLNHSFEHIPEPMEAVREVHRVLADGGCALVRVPLASSYAYAKYGTNWIQWDAPRHICLHTLRSMEMLAEIAGFKIERIEYDSGAFQFWGSEQCERGIHLTASNSYAVNPKGSLFSQSEIAEYVRMANALNARGEGDQAAFYLRKV